MSSGSRFHLPLLIVPVCMPRGEGSLCAGAVVWKVLKFTGFREEK